MRQRIEWLNELPDGYRERAMKNMEEEMGDILEPDMAEALGGAFVWKRTNEGHIFWAKVRDHYEIGTPLPPLPL